MIILQNAIGPARDELAVTAQHHADYCERHGYRYHAIETPAPDGWRPVWSKIVAINILLNSSTDDEVLVWLDTDAVIVKDEPLTCALPKEQSIGMVRASCEHLSWWNTGVMFIRRNSAMQYFFEQVFQRGPLKRASVGSPYAGDQGRINEMITEWELQVHELPAKYNSYRFAKSEESPVIRAYHGVNRETRISEMTLDVRKYHTTSMGA